MAGYGLRKKRPRYSDGRFLLSINDVINNALVCHSDGDDDGEFHDDTFLCFGVTVDGIDLSYDAHESTVQISLRYRKLIVTNDSLYLLAGVGVTNANSGHDADESGNGTLIHQIIPGMELIDGIYIARVHEIHGSVIHAKQWYKIVDSTGRTVRVKALQLMLYRDVEAVHCMIQAQDAE